MNHKHSFCRAPMRMRLGLALLGLLLLSLCAACTTSPQPRVLSGDEQKAVLAYSEPMTDSLLVGLNTNDYAVFARDFNAQMRQAMNEKAFSTTYNLVHGKIGACVSREVAAAQEIGEMVAVIYKAKFEQEEAVALRVVFEKAGNHAISGLWFDSPKLRQK